MLTKLPMPVELPLWALANLKAPRAEMRALLGDPHYVETDPRRTCGGEEDCWAYVLPTGQRVLVILDVTVGGAGQLADPPDLAPVLFALGISPDDPRLVPHAEPFAMS